MHDGIARDGAPAMTSEKLWFLFSAVGIVILIAAMVYVAFG
jgi:hypothetical protein